jgi:hypothetical protein
MEIYIYATGMNVGISILLACMLYALLELIRWRE